MKQGLSLRMSARFSGVRITGAGQHVLEVDMENITAAAHIAEKYDMPALAVRVISFLNSAKIDCNNLAEYFVLADKFNAERCQTCCKAYVRRTSCHIAECWPIYYHNLKR